MTKDYNLKKNKLNNMKKKKEKTYDFLGAFKNNIG